MGSHKFGLFRNAPEHTPKPAGTTVFAEGDGGHVMYAIKRGSVDVLVDGKIVDTIGEDEVFGEMALLERAPRSATVVTREDTELVEIDEAQFYLLVRQNPPFALQMLRVLSERLRHAHALSRVVEHAG